MPKNINILIDIKSKISSFIVFNVISMRNWHRKSSSFVCWGGNVLVPYIILFFFPPICLLIAVAGLWVNQTKWRVFLPILCYVFFIGAYCYEPDWSSNVDLVRYLPEVELYGELSLKEALASNGDILFARDMLFWICGKLQVPHMVPALTTSAVCPSKWYSIRTAFYV